jgi:tetratricopeptide (TPR) repeat protein
MSLSLAVLTKKAIDASLKQKWQEAIDLNSTILKVYPDNIDTKIRLGRCYIQTKDYSKAKKIFKEVLEKDPINTLALKNLELANKQKSDCNGNGGTLSTRSLLKEPGTTCETSFLVESKIIKQEDFTSGEMLPFKAKKKEIEIKKVRKGKNITIGSIEDNYIVQRVLCAIDKGAKVKITYTKWKDKNMCVLVKTSIPVFKPDKVDIRPYLRKGAIEEPEMDMLIDDGENE